MTMHSEGAPVTDDKTAAVSARYGRRRYSKYRIYPRRLSAGYSFSGLALIPLRVAISIAAILILRAGDGLAVCDGIQCLQYTVFGVGGDHGGFSRKPLL